MANPAPQSPPLTELSGASAVSRTMPPAVSSVALLASHPGRSLTPGAAWIRLLWAEASAWARAGVRIEGSLGTPGYELTALAALEAEGRLHLTLLPESVPLLLELRSEFIGAEPLQQVLPGGTTPAERDRRVLAQAELAVGVAIRRGGLLETLLLERFKQGLPVSVCVPPDTTADQADAPMATSRSSRVQASLRDPYFSGNWRLLDAGVPPRSCLPLLLPIQTASELHAPSPLLEGFSMPPDCPFELWESSPLEGHTLVHTTRPATGPWVGESRWTYLRLLAQGGGAADRRVGAVLTRILREGRLRGNGRLIAGGVPMVCLSARPLDTLPKSIYRLPLARWDGLPFGLVFRREVLETLGARPVCYLSPKMIEELSVQERQFVQKHQPPTTDWSHEEEWRLPGDLLLNALDPDDVRILLPSGACLLEGVFGQKKGRFHETRE